MFQNSKIIQNNLPVSKKLNQLKAIFFEIKMLVQSDVVFSDLFS